MIAGVSMGNLKKSSILLVMFQPMETSSFKSKDQENTPDPTKYHHFSSWNPQVSRAEKKVSVCASQKQSNLLILQRAQFQISSPEMWKGDLTSPKMDQNVGFHQKWWFEPSKMDKIVNFTNKNGGWTIPKIGLWTTTMVNFTTWSVRIAARSVTMDWFRGYN